MDHKFLTEFSFVYIAGSVYTMFRLILCYGVLKVNCKGFTS